MGRGVGQVVSVLVFYSIDSIFGIKFPRGASVDSSTPPIMSSRVRISSTPSMLLSICHVEKTGIAPPYLKLKVAGDELLKQFKCGQWLWHSW